MGILVRVDYEPAPLPPFDPDTPEHMGLVEFIQAYRSAGWFEGDDASDLELAQRARANWWAEWEDEFDTEGPDDGIFLCFAEPDRAIWFDPEADTCEGNSTYVHFLASLATLTGGDVHIADVSEDWQREPGRVYVRYQLNDDQNELALHEYDDWVDPKVIEQLNQSLPPGGRRFYVFDGGGQAFAITWASEAEAAALSQLGSAILLDRAPEPWPGVR